MVMTFSTGDPASAEANAKRPRKTTAHFIVVTPKPQWKKGEMLGRRSKTNGEGVREKKKTDP
jgi:hypothetical protein